MMVVFDVSVPAIFFTSIMLIPILRIRKDLLKCMQSLLLSDTGDHVNPQEVEAFLLDLPIIQFGDLQARRHGSIDETCFVCSEDYGNEDVVSQLSRCKHVFHTSCLQKELQRSQFCCPFCRNSVFKSTVASPCKHST